MLFIEYPKCTTCQKAKKWLKENNAEFEERHIVEATPSADELREWIGRSGLMIKRFFNTSGMKYKELKLKERLPEMTMEEQIELLASDGMLIKRPLLVSESFVLPGFKEKEWEKAIETLK